MYSVTGLQGASTGELVEAAAAALGALAGRPVPGPPGECLDLAERLGAALDMGEAALAGLVGRADRAGEPKARRFTGTHGWLRVVLGMRSGRAHERLTLARQLGRLPIVARRLADGTLAHGCASTIAEAVAHLNDDDCAEAEQILLGLVDAGHTATRLARFADKIKDVIDERDGTDKPDEDAKRGDRSWWRISTSLGGGGMTRGWFSPTLRALVLERLGPLAKPTGPDDTRDAAQRLADALETYLSGGGSAWNATLVIKLGEQDTAERAADAQAARREAAATTARNGPSSIRHTTTDDRPAGDHPTADKTDATDRVVGAGAVRASGAGADSVWASGAGAGADSSKNAGAEAAPPDRATRESGGWAADSPFGLLRWGRVSARLADGTPIPSWQARVIALNAGVSALVLGSDGIPLYLGRKVRFVTAHQRRVLEALYPTCSFDECEIPARYCQIDHVLNWTTDGTTDIDLLAPCCGHHNRLKYEKPDWVTTTRDHQGRWRHRVQRPRTRWARTRAQRCTDGPQARAPARAP